VTEGMEFVDKITRGDQANNGSVDEPDIMVKVEVK
jgi:peptidylprolyl isomerase